MSDSNAAYIFLIDIKLLMIMINQGCRVIKTTVLKNSALYLTIMVYLISNVSEWRFFTEATNKQTPLKSTRAKFCPSVLAHTHACSGPTTPLFRQLTPSLIWDRCLSVRQVSKHVWTRPSWGLSPFNYLMRALKCSCLFKNGCSLNVLRIRVLVGNFETHLTLHRE